MEALPLNNTASIVGGVLVVDGEWLARNAPMPGWEVFRKKVPTRAIRMDGPFVVETSEGPLRCADGWVAVDARGYPYPIAAEEFELIYERVDS